MTSAGLLGDVLAALHASGARPKLTPFVRANLAEIEKVLANGFTYAQLADALNEQGFRATENGFRSALHQARKTARPPEKALFPAPAGMNRWRCMSANNSMTVPRASGDEPKDPSEMAP